MQLPEETLRSVRVLRGILASIGVAHIEVGIGADAPLVVSFGDHGVQEVGDPHGRLSIPCPGDKEYASVAEMARELAHGVYTAALAASVDGQGHGGHGCVHLPGRHSLDVKVTFMEMPTRQPAPLSGQAACKELAISPQLADAAGAQNALERMEQAGVEQVKVVLSGYGDNSQVDSYSITPAEAEEQLHENTVAEFIDLLASAGEGAVCGDRHRGWENNEGGALECTFDIQNGVFSGSLEVNLERLNEGTYVADPRPLHRISLFSGACAGGQGTLLQRLQDAGAQELAVSLSGSGDQSQLDAVSVTPEALELDLPLEGDVEGVVLDLIGQDGWSGWENNEGGVVSAKVDLVAGTISYSINCYEVESQEVASVARDLDAFRVLPSWAAAGSRGALGLHREGVQHASILLHKSADERLPPRILSVVLNRDLGPGGWSRSGAADTWAKESLGALAAAVVRFAMEKNGVATLRDREATVAITVPIDITRPDEVFSWTEILEPPAAAVTRHLHASIDPAPGPGAATGTTPSG